MGLFVAPVRYGLMREVENFVTDLAELKENDTVILKTERGKDHGVVAGKVSPVDHEPRGLGQIERLATDGDQTILEHIRKTSEPEELAQCKQCIEKRKLPMKLAGIEHLFGGEKIIFYFLADGRVDFRELVKDLARRYRTRIEMRQIGVRDEARLLSDYEHCGQELCCRTFMRNLEPVSMRMAKTQKSTLDPSKISGHCGRLMCCLRFEDEVYSAHKKELPNKGEIVRTEETEGRVIGSQILARTVLIQTEGGDRTTISVDDIVERKGRAPQQQQRKQENRKDRRRDGGSRNDRGGKDSQGK